MELEKIAQVMIGVLAKREYEENGENSYLLFSLKNYEENQKYEELKTNKNLEEKIAKEGDLLFRLLYPNKIVYVKEEIVGKLVPSQLCIIRVQKEKMDPTVLKWYLESKTVQKELNAKITGSIIKTMPVASLRKIQIPEISQKQQEQMKQLIDLWEEEKQLVQKELEQKEKLYQQYLEKMVRRGET